MSHEHIRNKRHVLSKQNHKEGPHQNSLMVSSKKVYLHVFFFFFFLFVCFVLFVFVSLQKAITL